MRTLVLPTISPRDALVLCGSTIEDASLKARLVASEDAIVAACDAYHAAASSGHLYAISEHNVIGTVTRAEMKSLYKRKMAHRQGPGRRIYDALMASAPRGQCPLCTQRVVSTLDHYLPQSKFASVAVAPINLVPACADCNKAKHDSVAQTEETQTLHPFYDDIGSEVWLYGHVLHSSPPVVRFSVQAPGNWSQVREQRVKTHFSVFRLSHLYTSHAAQELAGIKRVLVTLLDQKGARAVQEHLEHAAASWSAQLVNCWQAAMYRAASADPWFFEGGLRDI